MNRIDFERDDVKLSVDKLARDFSFENNLIWFLDIDKSITREEISKFPVNSVLKYYKMKGRKCSRKKHIEKIVWLRDNLDSENYPILIELNRNPLKWVISDGNHRLAAAIVRGDKFVYAKFIGYVSEFSKFYRKYGYKKKEKINELYPLTNQKT